MRSSQDLQVAGQDRREKLTMSAANVDDTGERPEVIGFGNGLVAALAQGDHGTLTAQGGLYARLARLQFDGIAA